MVAENSTAHDGRDGHEHISVHLGGHGNGDGEIYRIAVDPAHHGRGLGREATLAGYRWLRKQPVVERATLWVDEGNEAAMRLYRGLGLEIVEVNREFTRS